MDRAKIALSEQEHRLMMDPSVILTKNRVMAKVYELFGWCSQSAVAMYTLPPEVAVIMPKIARGEAYKELPYVMLDYPRYFTTKDVLAIRNFFWWGNYVSITLHLKGKYIQLYKHALERHLEELGEQGFSVAVSADEWDHDLNGPGYMMVKDMGEVERKTLWSRPFIKFSLPFSLERWDDLPQQLQEAYAILGQLIDLGGE